jgi:NodT family efflux transporter outer membrane factor (OMF) lipoprotein
MKTEIEGIMERWHLTRTLLLITAGTLLAGGCTKVGPDFVRPEAPVAEHWIDPESPMIKHGDEDYSNWWKVFNDPTLDALIQSAYNQNLTLQIAGLRVLEARAVLGVATGNLYPQTQQASADYAQIGLSKNSPNFVPGIDRFFGQASIGFDAAWELDFWGRFRRGVESADANFVAGIAGYDDVLVTLTAEVARSYVLIRTLEERIFLARENVQIQQESLRIAQVRFDHGAVTELDVQQAKSLLRGTQALIPQLQTSLRQAENALSILLGMPPQDLGAVLAGKGQIPTAPTEVTIGVPAELLRRRPDIKQAELLAASQSSQIGIAKADLYPSFTLFGTIGLSSANTGRSNISDLFDDESITLNAGPSFRWNLFNYGRLKNIVRIEDARFEQLLVNYQNVVLQAAREVEDALVGFVRSGEGAGFLQESVEAAKRASELAMIQYREGVVDYQRVLDTDRFLTEQQDSYTATRGDIALNLIALYKALGGGWQMRLGKDVVPASIKEEMDQRTDWGDLLETSESGPASVEPPEDLWRAPD